MEDILLGIMALLVLVGLFLIWHGQREYNYEERYFIFLPHPFIGGTGAMARHCIVRSTCGSEQCYLPPEDHAYNREDARHEW